MKIRRILATAVAVAVTTPAVLLSVSPAFADTKPAAQTQEKPSIAELQKIADRAKKAYDEAVAAEAASEKVLEAAISDTAPLAVAAKEARKAAETAAAEKVIADQAVTDAQTKIDTLPVDATEEDKAAAQSALTLAQEAATKAGTAKTEADAKAAAAVKAADDARVAAFVAHGKVQQARKDALAALTAADEALARAKEEAEQGEECVPEPQLTTVATGLPSTVVAGTTTGFSLRVTNGTDKAMDDVLTYAGVHATDTSGLKDIDKLVRLQWSTTSSPTWQNVEGDRYVDAIGPLKAGAHADIKMRLKVDAAAPAGNGITFFAGDYFNEDGSCGGAAGFQEYTFDIKAAAAEPGKGDDAEPDKKDPVTSDPKPQGSASGVPVNATSGSLAATGSSSATSQMALVGGAAVVIGAGAVFIVRRRAGSNA